MVNVNVIDEQSFGVSCKGYACIQRVFSVYSAWIRVSSSDDFEKSVWREEARWFVASKTAKLLVKRTVRPLASRPVEPFAADGDDVCVRKQAS